MRALLAIVLLGLLVAGCSDPPAPRDDPDALGTPDVQVDEDAATGAISGVVVDEAIRPIAGASVRLNDGTNTTTDDGGQFVFEDLAPGTYFLDADAVGFSSVQSSVDVVAGELARARLLLQAVASVNAYHYTVQHTGFIQFSPALAGPILNIIIDTGLGMDNPLCKCTLRFDTTGQDVKTLVVEALWDDTLASPTGASTLYLEVYPLSLDDGTSDIKGGFHPSPILEHYPIGSWDPTGENETNTDWWARLSGDAYTVQYNQQYDLFVTIFVNAPAPDEWSLVASDV